jgi:hypothetical protein
LQFFPDAAPDAGIVLVAVGSVPFVPHPPQRPVSDGVIAVSRPSVILDADPVAVTPDPHGFLDL